MKDLVNWKCVSNTLTGKDTVIRKNWHAQKYDNQIDALMMLLRAWKEWVTGNGELDSFLDKEFDSEQFKKGREHGIKEALNYIKKSINNKFYEYNYSKNREEY